MVTAVVKAKKHSPGSRKKSKGRRVHRADLELVEDHSIQTGARIVTAHNGDEKPTKAAAEKVPRRRNPAPKRDKELAKLDKLFLLAWEETYESRKRRLS